MIIEVLPKHGEYLIYINGMPAGQKGDKDKLEIVAYWIRTAHEMHPLIEGYYKR